MIQRWVALGIVEAERSFRRVKGHRQMALLVAAILPKTPLAETKKAA